MGPFVSVLAAIAAHAAAQSGFGSTVELPIALLIGLVLPYALSSLAQRAQLVGQVRRARLWIAATEASGWIAFAVILLGCGWLETVRRWTGSALDIDAWPDLALALSFVPYAVYQLIAIDAGVRAHGGTAHTRRHLRSFQIRMFVACAAPIGVFVAASAVLGTSEWLRTQVEHVGLASALFTLVLIIALALMLPLLLRWSWNTIPFPAGAIRDLLNHVAERAQFQPRDVRLWETGDLMANAAIVGFGKRGRTVLLSDHLLTLLDSRELCAVYAHEIGHARRRHVSIFLAWMAAFVFLGDMAVNAAFEEWSATAGIAVGAAAFGLWYVSFGWLSRRCELDADLFSYETLQDLPALVSALERVGGRQRDVSGWRHFSVVRRIRFLARASTDAAFVRVFRRRLAVYATAGYLLAITGAFVQFIDLVGDLPRDRVYASLARGEYGEAADLARALEGDQVSDVRELSDVAARLDGPSVAVVEDALTEALRAGDIERALRLAQVGLLRGMRGARAVAEALDAAVGRDEDALEGLIQGLDSAWQDAVRGALARQE